MLDPLTVSQSVDSCVPQKATPTWVFRLGPGVVVDLTHLPNQAEYLKKNVARNVLATVGKCVGPSGE